MRGKTTVYCEQQLGQRTLCDAGMEEEGGMPVSEGKDAKEWRRKPKLRIRALSLQRQKVYTA